MQILLSQWFRVPSKVDRPDIFSVFSCKSAIDVLFILSNDALSCLAADHERGWGGGGFSYVKGSGTQVRRRSRLGV